MNKGTIQVICGSGYGKTAAAIGSAIISAGQAKSIIMIQFLKGNSIQNAAFVRRLEPEFKVFSFERREEPFETLTREQKRDEVANIQNGLNFAKKVMVTGECDVLILDEILRLMDYGILSQEDLAGLIGGKSESMDLILTGRRFPEELFSMVDRISCIEDGKNTVDNHSDGC